MDMIANAIDLLTNHEGFRFHRLLIMGVFHDLGARGHYDTRSTYLISEECLTMVYLLFI